MVYLDNNTLPQDVYIPRNDGFGSIHTGSSVVLEGLSVVVTADTMNVVPSSGVNGFSSVTVDATNYAQSNYDSGFDDGFNDGFDSGFTSGETHQKSLLIEYTATTNGSFSAENGYSNFTVDIDLNIPYQSGYTSGHTDGVNEEKGKLSAVTFTANTAVTISDGGFNDITVNVAQTGHTDQEMQEAYQSGYTSGETDGFSTGYASGETHQKSLLGSMTATTNGSFSAENGYSSVTVNTPTYMIEENKPYTATVNGTYTIVPSSASTTIVENYDSNTDTYYLTATTQGYDGLTGLSSYEIFTIVNDKYDFDPSNGFIYVTYNPNRGQFGVDVQWSGLSYSVTELSYNSIAFVLENVSQNVGWQPLGYYNVGYDVMSAVTLTVSVDTASTYSSGYSAGVAYQKSLLGQLSATKNGSYSAANGYSAVTVNLPLIAFTANTNGGWVYASGGISALTVDVPQSGSNLEDISFTATTNGDYTFTPSTGITTVNDHFDSDRDRYFCTINVDIDSYPSVGLFELVRIEDDFDESKGYIDVYIDDGVLDYDNMWNPMSDADIDRYGALCEIVIYNANRDIDWSPLGGFEFQCDGFSSVTITVDVSGSTPTPTPTQQDIVICTSGNCWFDTQVNFEYGDVIEVEHCTFGDASAYSYSDQQFLSGNLGEDFRMGMGYFGFYVRYFSTADNYGDLLPVSGTYLTDAKVVIDSSGFTINGVKNPYTQSTSPYVRQGSLIIFANNSYGGDVITNQTSKIGRVKIYDQYGNLKTTLEPMVDQNDVPYFHNVEDDYDIYASHGTPFYEMSSGGTSEYQSGFTDGFASGVSYQRSLLQPFTADTNGSFSAENGYSSVTVNVKKEEFCTLTFISVGSAANNTYGTSFIHTDESGNTIHTTKINSYRAGSSSNIVFFKTYEYKDSGYGLPFIFSSYDNTPSAYISGGLIFIRNYLNGVRTVILPSTITWIYDYAFSGFTSMQKVVIGDKIKEIGEGAFSGCTSLRNIYCYAETCPIIGTNAFATGGGWSNGTLHYPHGSDYSAMIAALPSGWTSRDDLYWTSQPS